MFSARWLIYFSLVSLFAFACGQRKDDNTPHAPGSSGDGDAASNSDASANFGDAGECRLGSAPMRTAALCGGSCVDLAIDGDHCGECGHACAPRAACNGGVCGAEPEQLVAAAPGCRSIRLVLDEGVITWADMGHGTIKQIATAGGAATSLVSHVNLAAIHTAGEQPLFVNSEPVAAGIVVHEGRVYWIESADTPIVDAEGFAHGGAGTTILSVRTQGDDTPTTLLPAALAPDASPVSSNVDAGVAIETPDEKPPISAIALSPDATTLYFAAGTRLYKIPSAGAVVPSDVEFVGFTSGPERGFATSLAADDRRLYFPTTVDAWVEMFDFTQPCTASGGLGYDCPAVVFGSHPIPLLDTISVKDGFLGWAKEGNVWRADLSVANPSVEGHFIYSDTVKGFGVTGFALGAQYAYFGESDYIEKGGFSPAEGSGPPRAQVLARGQSWPSSFAIDGSNVYWTTSACDIAFMVDSPQ